MISEHDKWRGSRESRPFIGSYGQRPWRGPRDRAPGVGLRGSALVGVYASTPKGIQKFELVS